MPRLVEELGEPLGIRTAQLYVRRRGALALLRQSGAEAPDLAGELERRLAAAGTADGIAGFPWAGTTAAGPTGLICGPGESFVMALGFDTEGEPPTPARMLGVVSPLTTRSRSTCASAS